MKTVCFLGVGETGASICSVHWSMGNAPKYAKGYMFLWERKENLLGGGEKRVKITFKSFIKYCVGRQTKS